MESVYLSLGSNLGTKKDNILLAIEAIKLDPYIRFIKQSGYYESEPIGVIDQPSFINAVICIETLYSPHELLGILKNIEKKIGRVPSYRWGPRLIDIDILYYGDKEIHTYDLTVPHPRIEERAFVMVPLMELDYYFKKKFESIMLHNTQMIRLYE